jgi:hypothetical protein
MAKANDDQSIDRLWDEWVVHAAGVGVWRRRLAAGRSRLGPTGPAPRDADGYARESREFGGGARFALLFAAVLVCRLPEEADLAAGWLAELQDLGVALGGRARTIAALLAARRAVAMEQGRTGAAGTLGALAAAAPLAEWHTATRLALSGMAAPLVQDPGFTVTEHPRKPLHGLALRLWDAVESGRSAEGAALLADGRIHAQASTADLVRTYVQLHRLVGMVVDGIVPTDPAGVITAACGAIPDGVLAGHVRLAWLAAFGGPQACRRQCALVEDALVTTPSSLLALAPVRAALVAGDGDLAERWLGLRRSRGLSSPGDTALWLRLHLARGDAAPAARAAGALVRDAAIFGCRRRMAFELSCGGGPGAMDLVEAGLAGASLIAPAGPEPIGGPHARGGLVAAGLRERIRRCAASDLPLVVVGEPGSGRGAVAGAVHAASMRAAHPFIAASCATADSDAPTGLFGSAGPLIRARGGTVLLRDLLLLDARAQARLAALLRGEAGPPGVPALPCRVMAALAPDEPARLHAALVASLHRLELRVPALRERSEEIAALAEGFLIRALGGRHALLAPELRRSLAGRPWPGNLPELRTAMERIAVQFPHAPVYGAEHLSAVGVLPAAATPMARPHPSLSRPARLAELRRLFQARGRLTRAEVIVHAGIAPATATADLRALVAEGCVCRHAPTPAPYAVYFTWVGGSPG